MCCCRRPTRRSSALKRRSLLASAVMDLGRMGLATLVLACLQQSNRQSSTSSTSSDHAPACGWMPLCTPHWGNGQRGGRTQAPPVRSHRGNHHFILASTRKPRRSCHAIYANVGTVVCAGAVKVPFTPCLLFPFLCSRITRPIVRWRHAMTGQPQHVHMFT